MEQRADIRSMTLCELREAFAAMGEKAFRAGQVFDWLHKKGAVSFEAMTNLSKPLQTKLAGFSYIADAQIEKKQVSSLDGTVKYLFRLHDGAFVEAVLMRYKHGLSVCISSQVGCKMGCAFCATGLGGFERNLTASEMLAQITAAQADAGERISHVVMMGMGEPLDNYAQVLRFLELATCEKGMNLSARHLSLSTCGVVDKIYDLMERGLQITLSISLHAPNDTIRNRIMPVNRRWNVQELLAACAAYAEKTGRRVSYEYAMIDGVNDSEDCARELAQKLKGTLCHVNLIPVNPVKENGFRRSGREQLQRFADRLESSNITVTVRRTLGADIDASCGQLRRKRIEKASEDNGNIFED